MKNVLRGKEAGFTFIEIIVVLVIIGIIAAIAVPKFVDLTGDAETAAAEGTLGAMQSATSLAFAKHRAADLDESGDADNEKFIVDAETLELYLDGGFPEDVEAKGKEVTLQDGTVYEITPETTEERAKLTKK